MRSTGADYQNQAPEVQTMYSLNMPVSSIRTKVRQEFERHRYVSQLQTVDVLLFNSHQEFQVSCEREWGGFEVEGRETGGGRDVSRQEGKFKRKEHGEREKLEGAS